MMIRNGKELNRRARAGLTCLALAALLIGNAAFAAPEPESIAGPSMLMHVARVATDVFESYGQPGEGACGGEATMMSGSDAGPLACGLEGANCASQQCCAGLNCCVTGFFPFLVFKCRDLQNDDNNCGSCGNQCHIDECCVEGSCVDQSFCS